MAEHDSNPRFFDLVGNVRAMRRLKPDPVPMELLRTVLDAGVQAPSGMNSQPWAFVVIQDPEGKKWFAERYKAAIESRFGAVAIPACAVIWRAGPRGPLRHRAVRALRGGAATGRRQKGAEGQGVKLGRRGHGTTVQRAAARAASFSPPGAQIGRRAGIRRWLSTTRESPRMAVSRSGQLWHPGTGEPRRAHDRTVPTPPCTSGWT